MSYEIAQIRIEEAKRSGYKMLDLSGLNLSKLPPEISELTELTHLFLDNNRLTKIEALKPLKKLKVLSLESNQIQDIPLFLTDLDAPLSWDKSPLGTSSVRYYWDCYWAIRRASDVVHVLSTVPDWTRALDRDPNLALPLDRALDRALDRVLDRAQTLDRDRDLDIALDRVLYLALNLARELARELALNQNIPRIQSIALALKLDPNLVLDRDLAQDLARALDRALNLARDRDRDLDLAQDLDLYLARTRALNRALDRYPNLTRNMALDQELDKTLTLALDLAQGRVPRSGSFWDGQIVRKFVYIINEYLKQAWIIAYYSFKKPITGVPGLFLRQNPTSPPPPEVIQQGNLAIKTFLLDFVEKKILNEVKVILVGEGAAGKTSLVKRLLKEDFNKKEPQTHGIKISKHKLRHHEQEFLVNFWDFGGQEIMHNTHQFFLTKRCLYMLVLDSRRDEKAEYWLNYIQSFGGNAPVIVVLNKIDENPSWDVNRKFLNKKYGNILDYYKVSCLNGEGIDRLKADMMNSLWDLELRNMAFPKGWFKVKQHLESMTDDYINYDRYRNICYENHVGNAQSQKVLLELLNDLGAVLNYEKLKWHDTQVLNPLWLTNAVYRIINSPILAKSHGRFNIIHLDSIINDERYQKENPKHWANISRFWKPDKKLMQFPEEKFLFIVEMMKEFELLYQIDEHEYLVPALLPDEEQTYQFVQNDPILSFVIEYTDFLPPAIIPRLMVKLNKYIYKGQVWKSGMVLQDKLLFHSIANIVLDKETRRISIEVRGKRKRDFLTVIRETIKEINATYQDIDIIEWIPLPYQVNEEAVLVDYLELEGLEAMKQENYFSGKLRKPFKVADLLNGIEKAEMRRNLNKVHIFVSYSHKDEDFKERLIDHLIPLVRLNKATLWDDRSIDGGDEWREEIFENLEKADIVLCLISSGFVASDFCMTEELNQALEAHDKGTKKVIPVRIKEVNWDNLEVAKIQGFPSEWMTDIEDNKSWTEVSKGVEKVINKMKRA